MGIGALKPFDEDTYRINPRLREFLSDHLANYHAFEALRLVRGTITQARAQWGELKLLRHASGTAKDQARLLAALEESISEIAYSVEHNLSMLHALLTTQYGNVENLQTKLRQNRYYESQVRSFGNDVQVIARFAEDLAEEANSSSIWEVRHMAVRRLTARIIQWTGKIKDAQSLISERLFKAEKMAERLRLLSRYSLWLGRHRMSPGWDIDVSASSPLALFEPLRLPFKPQPDVSDDDQVIVEGLLRAVARMPAQELKPRVPVEEEPQLLISDEDDVVTEEPDPVREAILKLSLEAHRSEQPISLLSWKTSHPELEVIGDETWLLYAGTQLRSIGLQMNYCQPRVLDTFEINDTFYDIEILPVSAVSDNQSSAMT